MDIDKTIITYFRLSEQERRSHFMAAHSLESLKDQVFAVGGAHIVVVKSDGTVEAVGDNRYGQCNVQSWSGVVKVAAGAFHTVGLKSDGTVVAAGDNSCGQCEVEGWKDIAGIYAENNLTAGVTADEKLLLTSVSELPLPENPDSGQKAATPADSFKYDIFNNSVILLEHIGCEEDVVIPETIEGIPVREIAEGAFFCSRCLSRVAFPKNLRYLGKSAFAGCYRLRSVTIPKGLEVIDSYAFYNCTGLDEIVLPESVRTVGRCAFSQCSYLKRVAIPDSIEEIEDKAFENCPKISRVSVSYDTKKKLANFSKLFTTLGYERTAYDRAASGFAHMPTLLQYFRLEELDDSVKITQYTGTASSIVIPEEIHGRPVTAIGENAFADKQIQQIILPESLKTIEARAFYHCTKLENVDIPDGVEEIGNSAFFCCSALASLALPDTIKRIGESAFGLTKLTELTIPDSIEEIGDYAFPIALQKKVHISPATRNRIKNFHRIFRP